MMMEGLTISSNFFFIYVYAHCNFICFLGGEFKQRCLIALLLLLFVVRCGPGKLLGGIAWGSLALLV